jgi:hypothetical protein
VNLVEEAAQPMLMEHAGEGTKHKRGGHKNKSAKA